MDRSLTTAEAPPPARLDYPFTPPLPGRSLEVAPGVHWVRMPLPYALDHINLWALEDVCISPAFEGAYEPAEPLNHKWTRRSW